MGTHFIPARRWSGKPGGRGGFTSRLGGANLARRVWICPACRRWHDPVDDPGGKKSRPPACAGCGERALLYFDSRGEALRFVQLWMMQDAGDITGLRHHPRFDLLAYGEGGVPVPVAQYEADAAYIDRHGIEVIEDYKPRSPEAQDPVFRLKRRHFEAQYGIRVRIVST